MADSMFGYTTTVPTLGVGKADVDGLTAEEYEEEEYDALNDETFGADVTEGDWEEGHEKLAELEDIEKRPEKDDENVDDDGPSYTRERQAYHYLDGGTDKEIIHSLSQLMLDDDIDDSAVSKCKRLPTSGVTMNNVSPPPAAIVESDHVGSPSTNNIWSTAAAPRIDNFNISGRDAYVAAFLNSIRDSSLLVSDLHIDDPCIVSAAKDFHRLVGNRERPPCSAPKLIPNVRTVEEIERDMMLLDACDRKKSPVSSRSAAAAAALLHEEVERDILLKPRARTVSEIERDIAAGGDSLNGRDRLSPSASPIDQQLLHQQQPRFVRPPSGMTNGGALIHRPQVGPYVLHPVMHPGTSPLTIHGHRSVVNANHGMASSPIQLRGSYSPPPAPFLLSMSPVQSPPAFRVACPPSPVWVRSYPASRMVPPQLTAYRRRRSYPTSRGAHPNARQQAFLLGQLRYPPPAQAFPYGPRPCPPLMGGGSGGAGGGFADAHHQIRRFTHSGQPLLQHMQPNQSRPRMPHQKRNSWSEPGSRGPPPPQYVQQPPFHFGNSQNYGGHRNGANDNDEQDEYANLMTQREKDWLVRIQLMQLQTDNPYLNDYYYTAFVLKKKTKELDKDVESTLLIPERSKAESRIYQPTQFEGSLGRLQVLSVNCPRKIIDLGQQHTGDSDMETQMVAHRELKKFRQLLLDIEKIYSQYLEMDDIDKKAAALPEDARTPLFNNKRQIICRIHAGLVGGGQERFAQIMSVRKGRHLVLRVLPRFSKEQVLAVVNLVLANLAIILKKDHREPVMPRIWSQLSSSLNDADFDSIVTLGSKMLNQSSDSTSCTPLTPNRSHLNAFLSHEVGLNVLDDLIRRVDQLLDGNEVAGGELKATWARVLDQIAEFIVGLADVSLLKSSTHLSNFVDHMQRFPVDDTTVNAVFQKLK